MVVSKRDIGEKNSESSIFARSMIPRLLENQYLLFWIWITPVLQRISSDQRIRSRRAPRSIDLEQRHHATAAVMPPCAARWASRRQWACAGRPFCAAAGGPSGGSFRAAVGQASRREWSSAEGHSRHANLPAHPPVMGATALLRPWLPACHGLLLCCMSHSEGHSRVPTSP